MQQGIAPQQIIDSLVTKDANGDSSRRQYGIIDLVDNGRTAAFTGSNCRNYKNHILAKNYAIQGNILQGPQILDSMEVRFLTTAGDLADKLMSALQGAKVPGADTRCLNAGISSSAAFIKVARPQDTTGTFFLDIEVQTEDNRGGVSIPLIRYRPYSMNGDWAIRPALSLLMLLNFFRVNLYYIRVTQIPSIHQP